MDEPTGPKAERADGPEDGALRCALAGAARGEEQAWALLVGWYGRRVFALARSRIRDVDTAEDITQSVFTTVAASLRDGGYDERGRFEAWLFRVAMNRVRDECRRARHRATPTDPGGFGGRGVEAEDTGAADQRDRDLARLRTALGELGEADREVIELRHHAQMSFKAIAEQLGEPVGTVLARHHRALGKLRSVLAEQAGAGGVL